MNDGLELPRHVVGLSGGKDSTALALRLMEAEPRDYEFICNATGNELQPLRDHLARMEDLLGKRIKYVGAGFDLYDLIYQLQMLPNFRARFCTRILKIEPTIEFFQSLPKGSVLYVGLRADEEMRAGLYGEDINVDFPFRRWGWGLRDVWRYLGSRGVHVPNRTDCDVCPYQRLGEWYSLWKNHPQKFMRGVAWEARLGHTFRSPQRDTWPASLAGLAVEFASGRIPRGADQALEEWGGEACRVCRL